MLTGVVLMDLRLLLILMLCDYFNMSVMGLFNRCFFVGTVIVLNGFVFV